MNDDMDKSIREADERECAHFWFVRWGTKGIILFFETLALGLILYSLWRY